MVAVELIEERPDGLGCDLLAQLFENRADLTLVQHAASILVELLEEHPADRDRDI